MIKARLAAEHVRRPRPRRAQALDELRSDAGAALENLRDLARGIYPPMLADLGLAAALGAQARQVGAAGHGRRRRASAGSPRRPRPPSTSAAIEALQNIAKYAAASRRGHRAARRPLKRSRFSVADDGAGFDAARTPLGAGLRNMSDRLVRPRRPPRAT